MAREEIDMVSMTSFVGVSRRQRIALFSLLVGLYFEEGPPSLLVWG